MENFSPPKVSSTVIFGLIDINNFYTLLLWPLATIKVHQSECIRMYQQWPWYYETNRVFVC